MIINNKGFTIIELVIVITIISILWTIWFYNYSNIEIENYLREYEEQSINRVSNLYKKSLIWINWYYNNNWVTDTSYIKLYCNQNDKTFLAYICDDSNSVSPAFNNCKQIDFPTLENIKYWWYLSKYTKKNITINNCLYIDEWWSNYNVWSYYITISTVFPNWKIETYKENWSNTIDNIDDDTIVDNVKINVKEGITVKDFHPLNLN